MNDEYGRLSLSTRRKLWAEFKIQFNPNTSFVYKTKDFMKKYTLALSCIQKVSFKWNNINSEASIAVNTLISDIDEYLHNHITNKQLSNTCFKYQQLFDCTDSSIQHFCFFI